VEDQAGFGRKNKSIAVNFTKTLCSILVLVILSCKNNNTTKKPVIAIHDTLTSSKIIKEKDIVLPKSKADRTKYHTIKDTVYIYAQSKDTLKYSKKEFNDIIDNFPELYEGVTSSPDTVYSKSSIWVDLVDSAGNKDRLSFSSEAGQDEYYILYAYFLKHKNGIAKFSTRRKKLFEIYTTLNGLFGDLSYGGTYFGHQYSRIEGYAEFSVYWFAHYEDYFDRPYNIDKQKGFYIAGLKQLIKDEEKDAERRNELFKSVNNLDKLITDNFYLRMAKSFQSDHY
jgi:hypothetical protein